MLLPRLFILLIAARIIEGQTTDCAHLPVFHSCIYTKLTKGCHLEHKSCYCSMYSMGSSCHKSACPGRNFPYESDNYEFCATTGTAAPHAFTLVFPSRASATITSGTVSSPSMSSSGSVLASRSSPSKSSSGSALATAPHNSAGAVLAMPLGMFLVIASVAGVAFF